MKPSTSPRMKRDRCPGCWSLHASQKTIESFCPRVSFSPSTSEAHPVMHNTCNLEAALAKWKAIIVITSILYNPPRPAKKRRLWMDRLVTGDDTFATTLKPITSFAGFGERIEFLRRSTMGARVGTENALRGQMGSCSRRAAPISLLKAPSFISLSF